MGILRKRPANSQPGLFARLGAARQVRREVAALHAIGDNARHPWDRKTLPRRTRSL